VSHPAKRQFARVVTARQKLLDLRAQRMDQLARLRNFAKNQLMDFVSTVDPITAQRYCEIQADGSKTRGDMAVSVVFYEGTKLAIAIDQFGKYSCDCTHKGMLADLGELAELYVTADQTRAQLTFESEDGGRRYVDLGEAIDELIEVVVRAVEADVPESAPVSVSVLRPPEPTAAAPVVSPVASPVVAGVASNALMFSIR